MAASRSSTKSNADHPANTLEEFMRQKARVGCPVCQLPGGVRAQLGRAASKRGFSREDQVEWLRRSIGAQGITLDILNKHLAARHDSEEALNEPQ